MDRRLSHGMKGCQDVSDKNRARIGSSGPVRLNDHPHSCPGMPSSSCAAAPQIQKVDDFLSLTKS